MASILKVPYDLGWNLVLVVDQKEKGHEDNKGPLPDGIVFFMWPSCSTKHFSLHSIDQK